MRDQDESRTVRNRNNAKRRMEDLLRLHVDAVTQAVCSELYYNAGTALAQGHFRSQISQEQCRGTVAASRQAMWNLLRNELAKPTRERALTASMIRQLIVNLYSNSKP